MKNQTLPYGLRPPEVAYLILLAATYYFTGTSFRGTPWPVLCFGASLVGGVLIVAGRCREEWGRLPNKPLFFSLAAAWVALFTFWGISTLGYTRSASLFLWLMDIYTSPFTEDAYGLMIPFVVLGLYWWKRQELVSPPTALRLWWPAMLLFFFGLLLHLVGFVVQLPILSVVGFLTGLYALSGLVWGRHWLQASFFPYFLLGFCVPLSGLVDSFTFKLQLLVSWLVAGVAHLGLAPDLVREGTQLFDAQRTFAYEVAAACSGIRSFMALLALLTIYAFVSFKSPWRRGAMMLAALPLAVLGNVVRLCFTIGVAELFGQNAGKAVETKFGFVTFVVALGCAYLLARWLEKGEPTAHPGPLVMNVKPLLAAALVLALIGSAVGVLQHAKSGQKLGAPGLKTRPIPGSANLEVLLPETVPGFKSELVPQASIVTNKLPQDTSFGQRLYTADDGFQTMVNVVLMGTDRTSIHKPEICLVGQGWKFDNQATHPASVAITRPHAYELPVMRVVVNIDINEKGQTVRQTGVYTFWFVDATHLSNQHNQWKLWMIKDFLLTGVLDRWAYVTFFSVCAPGQEEATFVRQKQLIAAAVPEFQLTVPPVK